MDKKRWPEQKLNVAIMVNEIISETYFQLPQVDPLFDCEKFSSLEKIFNITYYVFKFLSRYNNKFNDMSSVLY